MNQITTGLVALWILSALAGCSCDTAAGPVDAGPADAGLADAGAADAGLADAGAADAGLADAGAADAGLADAGAADAGLADAGPADAGLADAGPADAGLADAGAADAGPEDLDGGVVVTSCAAPCHGDADSPAPPADLDGLTDTGRAGVGAHRAHLEGDSRWHRPVTCVDCHQVPASLDAPGHIDTGLPAETVWSSVATALGAEPLWDGATCAGTHCHGATLGGGSLTEPTWTRVDGAQARCGTCHGVPPPAPHPAGLECGECHPTMGDHMAFVLPAQHIDGVLQVEGGCTTCHATARGAGGVRRAVAGDLVDVPGPGSHVAPASVTDGDCGVCHSDGRHRSLSDPAVELRHPDALGTAIAYDGTGASLEDFCLGCHDAAGPMGFDVDGDATNGRQPFSTGGTPTDIASYWPGATHAGALPAELGDQACLACHGGADPTRPGVAAEQNVHGSELPYLLSGVVAGEAVPDSREGLCLSCHDGAPASDIEGRLALTGAPGDVHHHPIAQAEQAPGRPVGCSDCHDPHRASPGAPLAGATGVDLTGQPVGPGTADDRPLLEHEVCFRCHGDAFNAARPRTTNKRTDFDPANGSFHPVAEPGRNTSSVMNGQLLGGLTVGSTIRCTDCHNNEATADVTGPAQGSSSGPKGPHGSTHPFVLRAAYVAEVTGPSTWDAANYRLCFLCHDVQAFTTEDRSSTNFDDGANLHNLHMVESDEALVTCANCHWNAHGNQNVDTTTWEIDGVRYDTPPAGYKTRGVSFSPDVLPVGVRSRPTFAINTASRMRSCSVDCHGRRHGSWSYVPGPGDDDPLTY